jgi:protein ImuB
VEDPDSSKQLPLLAHSARIVALPRPVARVAAVVPESAAPVTTLKASPSLWYALVFPQLAEQTPSRQQQILEQLAGLAQAVSATISFHPHALVCEVRSSLNYFGGIEVIHDRIKSTLSEQLIACGLSGDFLYSASPTVSGSLLLARSGQNCLVYRHENLRSALGQLPTSVLELNKEQNRRLYNMGIRYLRDIWRLPGDGLRKRFGSDFVNLLHKALGSAPEPTRNYLPPPAFLTSYDLPYEVELVERILPVADEMLAQLCDFLRRRDLSASHLVFSLSHEKRSSTKIAIGLRQPSRSREHLSMLLETHIANLSVPAPIVAVSLEVKKFDAFMSHSDHLLLDNGAVKPGYTDRHLDTFIEQLQARLGGNPVKSIATVAEHCPEYACEQRDYNESGTRGGIRRTADNPVASNPRPLWLLSEPVQLVVRNGKLYHRKPITLVNGPERIETRWWSDGDIRRDYYVAREDNGSRLWIFREKTGAQHWYLHGFFA